MLAFIKREKIYILMILFIMAVNLINAGHARKEKEVLSEEKSLSSMTFQEMGITEDRVKDFFESERPSAAFFKYTIALGFFIFLAAIIFNIVFLFRRKRISLDEDLSRKVTLSSWGILDVIKASIVIIFTAYIIGIAEAFILKKLNIDMSMNLRMIFGTFFVDIIAALVIFYFIMVKYKEGIEVLGLRFSSFFKNILSGITSYIFMLPVLLAVLLFSIWILNHFGYSPPPQPVFEAFMEEKRNRVLLFLTIFVSVFGPIVEEIFFRGFMYSAIRKRVGVLGAAFLSASIFSLLHTNIAGFLPIMMLGVLLAYLYETTGSLVASITVHVLHNSAIICFVFFIKQLLT